MISYNSKSRTVYGPSGAVVLTRHQAAVLVALPTYPNAITSADLVRKVWNRDPAVMRHISQCRTMVWQLRGRLADVGFAWSVIHSEYRTGYSLRG